MTETSPPSWTRVLLGIIGVPLVLVLALALVATWRLEKRVWDVGTALIDGARALEAARWPRPSHVDTPTPGTFGQALAPLMAELRAFKATAPKLSEDERQRCRDVRDGRQPVSELPQVCQAWLERDRSLVERVLKTARTEEAGPPEGLRTLAPPTHPDHESLLVFMDVLRLTALEVRLRADRGQADSALELCLDGLALARDLGHGTGLIGAMTSSTGDKLLYLPCTSALRGASPAALLQAVKTLRRIREGLSPFSSAMHQESILLPVLTLGEALDPQQVKQFPVGAQALMAASSALFEPETLPIVRSLLLRDALLELFPIHQRMVPLMDLPAALRDPRLEEELNRMEHSRNPLVSLAPSSYAAFARRVDQQRAWLDLLVALALVRSHRAEHGEWPSTLPPLYPEHAVLLPTPLRLQPGPGDTLTLVPEEVTLRELETGGDPKELASTPFEAKADP